MPDNTSETSIDETEFRLGPAQGDHLPDNHAKNVEEEAAAHGLSASLAWDMSPGAGQGGN